LGYSQTFSEDELPCKSQIVARIERHNLVAFRAELARNDCMNTVMADTEPKLAFHFESAEFLAEFHGVFVSLKAFQHILRHVVNLAMAHLLRQVHCERATPGVGVFRPAMK